MFSAICFLETIINVPPIKHYFEAKIPFYSFSLTALQHRSEPNPKNPIIAAFFRNIGLADELGLRERNIYKIVTVFNEHKVLSGLFTSFRMGFNALNVSKDDVGVVPTYKIK
jgi:hypothetical protein